jgi:superfamily II DNA or RNA helicase
MEENAIKRSQKKLRSYQKNVVEYMKNHRRLLVFHKMGTGKTLTAVTVSQSYLDQYPRHKVIVISPATLIDNFRKEMFQTYRNIKHRGRYEFFSIQKATNLFKEGKINCENSMVIIDEVHNYRTLVKMSKGKIISGVNVHHIKPCLQKAHKVLLLTGTPVYNSPKDLQNIMTFLKTDDLRCRVSFHDYEKDDKHFPLRVDAPRYIEMSPEYKRQYDEIVDEIYKEDYGGTERRISLRVFHTDDTNRLKKFATAIRRATQNLDNRFEHNRKLEFIKNLILKLQAKNRKKTKENKYKIIIYSAFKGHGIELIRDNMPPSDRDNIAYATISGDTKMSERQRLVRLYNKGTIKILFLTKAAGEGLDLKGTDIVVIMEPNWNESSIEQVIARAIRFKSHENRPPKRQKVTVLQLYHTKPYDDSEEYLGKLRTTLLSMREGNIKDNCFDIDPKNSIDETMRAYSLKKQILLDNVENNLKHLSIEHNDCSELSTQQHEQPNVTSSRHMVPLTEQRRKRISKSVGVNSSIQPDLGKMTLTELKRYAKRNNMMEPDPKKITKRRFLTSNRKDTLLSKIQRHLRTLPKKVAKKVVSSPVVISTTSRVKKKLIRTETKKKTAPGVRVKKKKTVSGDFLDNIFGIVRKSPSR